MVVPNFLIIGAHKAGTSSLHRYLRQHPEVFMPALKELRFFSYDPDGSDVEPSPYAWGPRVHPIKTWDEYVDLFTPVTTEKAIGEASPCYLNHPRCPTRIKQALPDVRLIVSLRDPVDRAYSGYLMAVRDVGEARPFADTTANGRRSEGTFDCASARRHPASAGPAGHGSVGLAAGRAQPLAPFSGIARPASSRSQASRPFAPLPGGGGR